jgi:anti-anti-sigma factor
MLGYGIDGEAAFELLRWGSQQRNVRLVTLAERLVAAVEEGGGLGSDTRQRLDDFFFASLGAAAPEPAPVRQSPGLDVTFDTAGDVPVVRVEGPVDLATAHELTAAVTQLMIAAREVGAKVVDLRDVTHLGSVGVSALTAAHRRASAAGVQFEMSDLQQAKQAVPDLPVIANTGVRAERIAEIFSVADGVIVGTSLKVDGDTWKPVDPDRAHRLMDAARAARSPAPSA